MDRERPDKAMSHGGTEEDQVRRVNQRQGGLRILSQAEVWPRRATKA